MTYRTALQHETSQGRLRPPSRKARAGAFLTVGIVFLLLLPGCQRQSGIAAQLGDVRITENKLNSVVRNQLANANVRVAVDHKYQTRIGPYQRLILSYLVKRELAREAGRRLGISVPSSTVDEQMRKLASQEGGEQQLSDAFTRSTMLTVDFARDVLHNEELERRIGYELADAEPPDDIELREQYENRKEEFTIYTVGRIEVANENLARGVIRELNANPDSYGSLATQHASPGTLTQPVVINGAALSNEMRQLLRQRRAGEAFQHVPSPGDTAIQRVQVLFFVGRSQIPFEGAARLALAEESDAVALETANEYLRQLASEMDLSINPRYGEWGDDEDVIVEQTDPLVRIVGREP